MFRGHFHHNDVLPFSSRQICNCFNSYLSDENRNYGRRRSADYATPLYPQKLALTSPTSGGEGVWSSDLELSWSEPTSLLSVMHKRNVWLERMIPDFLYRTVLLVRKTDLMAVHDFIFGATDIRSQSRQMVSASDSVRRRCDVCVRDWGG
jgi:hypothetical protein